MKYKGKEIGKRPTLAMVEELIRTMDFDLDANEFYQKYEKRNWLTTKHKEPLSLEALMNAYNGIVISDRRKKGIAIKERNKKKGRSKESKSDYYELLKDPRWQKRRLEIMQRDGWKCKMCGSGLSDGIPLNVHHYVYHKGYLPWEYPDKDLITLCRDCHHKLHEEKLKTPTK